jgi:hypothetical protein
MCDGTRNAELSFLHLVGSAGHVVLSGAFGARNVEPPFFMLRWSQCSFYKKRAGTYYTEIVFSNLVGYVSHVVYSNASRA